MSIPWKTVRVFVSSTFLDMQAERDHLVRFVFPRLREELLQRRIHFVDVDLRWGVTSEQDTLGVCRQIIKDCRPRFLCLLGGRYGDVKEGKDISVTHEEVNFGVLDRLGSHGYAFFYFRDESATNSIIEQFPGEFREQIGGSKENKLKKFKRRIANAGLKPFLYPAVWDNEQRRIAGLQELGHHVYEDLLESIRSDPELCNRFTPDAIRVVNEFDEEKAAMEAFVEERKEHFVIGDRQRIFHDLLKHAVGHVGGGYMCLTGGPGSGKSALLAELSSHATFNSKACAVLISHFVGASLGSTDMRRTLRRLCFELTKIFNPNAQPAEIPDDPGKLRIVFPEILEKASTGKRVVILLDAVDQFDSSSVYMSFSWLPLRLPENSRIIVSALAGPVFEEFVRGRCPPEQTKKLLPLSPSAAGDIVNGFLGRYRKTMTQEQRDELFKKTDSFTPLYLLTVLEELRTLSVSREVMQSRDQDREILNLIRKLPPTTLEFFTWVLKRLSKDDGFRDATGHKISEELVSRFGSLLAASRHGLSHRELSALLAPGGAEAEPSIPDDALGNVAALVRLLRPYLMWRGELLDFYHGAFRDAAKHNYLSEARKLAEAHYSLAAHYQNVADPTRDSTWCAPGQQSEMFGYTHAMRDIVYHSYQFALASGDSSSLFDLVNDERLRRRQFEHFASPVPPVEHFGYALEIAANTLNVVQLTHFAILRTGFARGLSRSYLYHLSEFVRGADAKLDVARGVARLIPEPSHRGLGLLLIAWILRENQPRRDFAGQLIAEAISMNYRADIYQSGLLLEIASALYHQNIPEAIQLIDLVPPSPIQQSYVVAWSSAGEVTRELAKRALNKPAQVAAIREGVLEEFRNVQAFTQRFATGFNPWPSSKHSAEKLENLLCDNFGPAGAAGAYFLMACEQIHSGNDRLAEVLITRGIYLYASLPQPILRTLAATVEAFGARGESEMAHEQEARVRTLTKLAQRLARTSREKSQLDDENAELVISTDHLAGTWRPPGAREIFQQTLSTRSHSRGIDTSDEGDAVSLLANARLLVAQSEFHTAATVLTDITTVAHSAPREQQVALLLATHCLACVCGDSVTEGACAVALAENGTIRNPFFPSPVSVPVPMQLRENPDVVEANRAALVPEMIDAVYLIATSDPRCVAAVALALRMSGQSRVLLELLWRSVHLGLPVSNMDAVLCEIVRLPNLSSDDLRLITDEILFSGKQLSIPSGLGWYYYPGIMLIGGWSGCVLVAVGLNKALSARGAMVLGAIVIFAGVAGAFADLWLWQKIGLWKRPERSRRWVAELGTIALFWGAASFAKPLLVVPDQQRVLMGVGAMFGLAAESLIALGLGLRGMLFCPWHAGHIITGTAIAAILSLSVILLVPRLVGDNISNQVLVGLFLSGSSHFIDGTQYSAQAFGLCSPFWQAR